jgi:hypothetical protein
MCCESNTYDRVGSRDATQASPGLAIQHLDWLGIRIETLKQPGIDLTQNFPEPAGSFRDPKAANETRCRSPQIV